MGMLACCFVHLTSQGANSFERSQIRIEMPTDIEDVRSSGKTGSDRRAVKATRLSQSDIRSVFQPHLQEGRRVQGVGGPINIIPLWTAWNQSGNLR
jgi:hypothetical protein